MSSPRRDISFKTTDGLELRGWFYPAGNKAPTVILSHGLTGIKELFLDAFAARFQAAGFASIVYDCRNFGASDGLPRYEVNAFHQIEDYHDAITFATTLTEVDPELIAIWGSSYSGGNVIQAAAVDRRAKAVIAQVPFVSGNSNAPILMPIMPAILADRAGIAAGKAGEIVSVVASSLDEAESRASTSILPEADAYKFFVHSALPNGVKWENKITLQSLFKLLKNEPRAYIHRISPTPFLMVVAEEDTAVHVPTQLAVFGEAGEPKELFFMAKTGHFDPYSGPAFEVNVERQIRFLKMYLT
ncbi:Polyketide transferase [Lachnellula hyalina]|uniref:Polyketide transferase n=1 Tax=Lachnellula hyalina TaxID=1316788 RepID=A0A8H8U3I5_9HELO|nr:Polyketide transferase [Lachnellula hyalina]TVY29186.1 Polyketide transferase [Lachnellula hyalina]